MQELEIARAHHLAGRLEEAERQYREIVAAEPGHSGAWHLLGVLAYQTGQAALAADLIGRALLIEPSNPDFLNNLGLVCRALGRPKDAEKQHRAALRIKPDHAAAHGNLGIALADLGRRKEAETSYRRAIALDPSLVDAMNNLGNLLREAGRLQESEKCFRDALKIRPDFAEGHSNLGNVLRLQGRLDEAERCCRQAIVLRPAFVEGMASLGLVLQAARRPAEAEKWLRQALAARPEDLDARIQLGNVLWDQERVEEAAAVYGEALVRDPASALAHNNLGIVLAALGRPEQAEAACRRAIALKPDFSDAHSNLGNALRDQGRLDEAAVSVGIALKLSPANGGAQLNDALLRLLRGDYEGGWRAYEARWKDPVLRPDPRRFPQPCWDGTQDLGGKSILLHAEQGLGDTVQFLRYAPLVAAKGAEVLLEVQGVMASALAGMPGVERIVAASAEVPAADFHCPLMSLPFVFGTRLETIPSSPYLTVDAAAAGAWRRKLSGDAARLVGLCWKGNPRNRLDRMRSASLAAFLPLLDCPGTRFVSLQQDLEAEERALVAGRQNFIHEGMTFEDKAALAGALDLVISVDTVWAHWAGAIGRPLWVLLPQVPPWMWLLERGDSPWYGSARLFRQARRGDWHATIAAVALELERLPG